MGGSIGDLVPELQSFASDLVTLAGQNGLQPRITSTVRTHSEQARLYRRYLAGQAGFPVVPPGQSAHEYGEAFDMVVSPMEYLADLGAIWRSWGGGWGPGDAIHFELPGASERAAQKPQISELNPFSKARAAVGDFLLPGSTYASIAGMLLQAGYGESEVSRFLQEPVETIYRRFPWLQWADLIPFV